jgi:F420-dependent oxidoreductase-like protein
MRFVLMLEPQQGLSYAEQLAIARRAEAAGFEALFRSDHYSSFPGRADNPTTDAWAVLAGLARETERIRLGTLVSPVTFRLPGNVVKLITTIDDMSGGRLEVGLGAGWNDIEHASYGLPFPGITERADMLEEELEIVRGLLEGPDGWTFEGRHWRVRNAVVRPKPTRHIRLIVGGEGSPRSMRIAARFADEFNLSSVDPDTAAGKFERLAETCRAAGRDPDSMTRSVMVGVLVGSDASEVDHRVRDLMRALGQDPSAPSEWLEARRRRWVIGTPDEARAMVARLEAIGAQRIMLQDFLPRDLDMIDLIGREIVRA